MAERILVTGGAGFIGSNLVRVLLKDGFDVVVLDALITQVHPEGKWEAPPEVTFFHGDVRDKEIVSRSLEGVHYIIHLAAETGVGQSSYEIARYVGVNEFGTGVLLEEASKQTDSLRAVILASSRAVYGEGRYLCERCGPVYPSLREAEDLKQGRWDPHCPQCNGRVEPTGSVEDQPLRPASVYGITKHNQEQLTEQFSESFGIPSVALRFQNVYGPGQSLSNPYTGILSIFSTRIMSGNPVLIYEDGFEKRDFVYIDDIVDSICLPLRNRTSGFQVYNVGSGKGTSVSEVAKTLVEEIERNVPVEIVGKYRIGDIRHAWADIRRIREEFGFAPKVSLREGLRSFVSWVKQQPTREDHYKTMEKEMMEKGLLGRA
jgi:dTDP-L-rhamnose 4-epimerase